MHDRPKTNSTKTARVLLSLGALALSVPALTSCNIVTPVAYIIEGPGQIEAEFTLADKKTVVFADDPRNILPRSALLTAIGDGVSFDLMEREILSSTVSTAQAISVARGMSGGDARNLASIEKIGRALDCAQVIHIQPFIFDLYGRSDSQGLRPTISVRVKVLDLDAKARVFPPAESQPEGREVMATIRETSLGGPMSRSNTIAVEDRLVQRAAIEVARLFYKHDRIDLGENLGTRRR